MHVPPICVLDERRSLVSADSSSLDVGVNARLVLRRRRSRNIEVDASITVYFVAK